MNEHKPLILMYHSISERQVNPNDIWVSPDHFETQMNVLKSQGLRGVSMRDYVQAQQRGETERKIILTFDDAYVDFLQTATPIMEKFGFTGTVFVVSGAIGKDNDWKHHFDSRPHMSLLDEEGLREVVARGMEVGAHTVTHPVLTKLDTGSVRREVKDCKIALEEILDRDIHGFCYPYGLANSESVRAIQEAGFRYSCSISQRPEMSDFDLPRVGVRDRDNFLRFTAKINFYRSVIGKRRIYNVNKNSEQKAENLPAY